MVARSNAVAKKLQEAGFEAYKAGLYRQAAKLFGQARRAAEEASDERQRVLNLFWEGESLFCAGEADAALPLLLQVAQSDASEADPADIYNAMVKAIDIALKGKPVALFRRLLAEAWLVLERMGKEVWRHKLHCLEGDLHFLRGDFDAALHSQQRGWETHRDEYPCFTAATHLVCLCACSFRLRDRQGLAKWVEEIEANRPAIEWDRLSSSRCRLLLLRAGDEPERHEARSTAAESARSILRRVDTMEAAGIYVHLQALRALALFANPDEAERRMGDLTPLNDSEAFDLHLFRGDLALCQTRVALALEPRDDEWDQDFPLPSPPFRDRDGGLRHLEAAREAFESARPVALREDERLETTHYTRTLDGRLERTRALSEVVEASA